MHAVNSSVQLSIHNMRDVLNLVYDARSKWLEIGVQLGIIFGTLEAIREDHPKDCDKCLTELLNTWLKGTNPSPTWKALADALRAKATAVQVKVVSKGEDQEGMWSTNVTHTHCPHYSAHSILSNRLNC